MKLSDFDFNLPEQLIALRPAVPRSSARLLLARGDAVADRTVTDLVDILQAGDHLILNDTKVIPARLSGLRWRQSAQGNTSSKIEVTLLAPLPDGPWQALVKPRKRLRVGEEIVFSESLVGKVIAMPPGEVSLAFNLVGAKFEAALKSIGAMPLPPYIASQRAVDAQDNKDYQTVFARQSGAVAAPTASLHFDQTLLDRLAEKGVKFSFVTLHVGAGTFLPVKVDNVRDHKMHSEWGDVSQVAADEINQTLQSGGRVIPVGTTALRLIETAALAKGKIAPWRGETDIFIMPGYDFKISSGLMTNFHLPKSTLMMLVSALMGKTCIENIYQHAISTGYRFFSYGDSSLLLPDKKTT